MKTKTLTAKQKRLLKQSLEVNPPEFKLTIGLTCQLIYTDILASYKEWSKDGDHHEWMQVDVYRLEKQGELSRFWVYYEYGGMLWHVEWLEDIIEIISALKAQAVPEALDYYDKEYKRRKRESA